MKLENIKVDAFVLAYKREKNIPSVIRGLKKQSFINNIYVFHNSPSIKKVSNVINIFSEFNYGCIARHAIALLSNPQYVLFVDDDLELKKDFSKRFIEAIKKNPYSIIGFFGTNIDRHEKTNKIFESGGNLRFSKYLRYVDVIKGRVHLTHRINLLNSFKFIIENQFTIKGLMHNDFIMDDLILNLSTQLKTKIPSVLLPLNKDEIKEQPAPFGAEAMPQHYLNRCFLVKEFLKQGWAPKANNKKYYNLNLKSGKNNFLLDEINFAIKKNNLTLLNKSILKLGINKTPLLYLYNYAGLLKNNKNINKALEIYKYISSKNNDKKLKALSYYQIGEIFLKNNKKQALKYYKSCIIYLSSHEKAKLKIKSIIS